ncbi:hypothetical protein FIU87_03160 [Bacillus sp. THAF10]|uniref:hypothetical protein n=1 Tax=Bacillus sp. THAF10 TaxID=2587848 RepID=UPI001268CFFC|nr:hypothetical protein [Bacillus sp. THAF10]QFT87640.1 hypothetical protein FIU87_03160 [Bacillus sp. THAF10]
MQIKHVDIDLNIGETPYFQVDNSRRARFLLSSLEDNHGLLKRIFSEVFKGDSSVDCTFLSAYETNGVIQRENLRGVG